jgi:hypothetical protein
LNPHRLLLLYFIGRNERFVSTILIISPKKVARVSPVDLPMTGNIRIPSSLGVLG